MTIQQIAQIAQRDGLSVAAELFPTHWVWEYRFSTFGARVQFTCGNGKEFTLYSDGKVVNGHE